MISSLIYYMAYSRSNDGVRGCVADLTEVAVSAVAIDVAEPLHAPPTSPTVLYYPVVLGVAFD